MQFDWVTFGLQLVNVLVLVAILRHFLFRPVAAIIAQRQAATQAVLDAAEASRAEAETAAATACAEVQANAAARQKILTDAQSEAETLRKHLAESARAEAHGLAEAASVAAAHVIAEAQTSTLIRARDLAQTIARRACLALPDPPTTAGYTLRLAAALAAMPADARQSLLTAVNLRLIAPHPLTPTELAGIAKTLGTGPLAQQTDPDLIAGLDLRSDNGVIRNSLASDLDRIARALTTDGDSHA